MQEPKVDGDSDLVSKVNDAINNPGGSGSSRGATSDSTPTPSEQDMQTLLQSMSQSQLMQLIGGTKNFVFCLSLNYLRLTFDFIC
jgi:hypothetical protein